RECAVSTGALGIDEGDLVTKAARHVGVDEIGYGVIAPAFGDVVHPGPPPSAFEQPREQSPRQHAGDAPAIMAGRERGLHRHDLVAHQGIEALEHTIIERPAAGLGGTREHTRRRAWRYRRAAPAAGWCR